MKPHPTETPEYWEDFARDERAFAKEPRQTVESKMVHLRNAEEYEAIASRLRATENAQ